MEVAANNGNPIAQYNMGWIYARGLLSRDGLMQDLDIAKMAEQENNIIEQTIDKLESELKVLFIPINK